MDELQALTHLIKVCGQTRGNAQRCQNFQKHGAAIKPLIALIYDPYTKFHVTSKSINKRKVHNPPLPQPHASLRALLHSLGDGELRGNEALDACLALMHAFPDHADAITKALNKDLKIRVGLRMCLQAFPLLVSKFSCALSHPLEKHQKFFDANKSKWFISRKLDGCRCMFVCEQGRVVAYSRSGHVYPDHIQGLSYFLDKFRHIDGVLDGEMGVIDSQGQEYFNVANSLMNPNASKQRSAKNVQMPPNCHMCFFAFDWIPLATFKKGQGGPVWSLRQKHLHKVLPCDRQVRILEQHPMTDEDRLWNLAASRGWEGLMYRLDGPYEGKKSRRMLKRKIQHEDEYVITSASASAQLDPNSANMVQALEHVSVEHKGCQVFVGSGWTWDERVRYGKNPSQLVGHFCTVKHYGETHDRHGNSSLRHPTIKAMWPKSGRTH